MIIGMLGLAPVRRVEEVAGGYVVYVQPPALVGKYPEVSVKLTPDQYARYQEWLMGSLMIQDALPELSPSTREMLMTGLGDEDFHRIARDPDED